MSWSEAILEAIKDVKFFKKSRQSNVKEFLKNLRKAGKNGNRPIIRKQRRVITFEDREDLCYLELCGEDTIGE